MVLGPSLWQVEFAARSFDQIRFTVVLVEQDVLRPVGRMSYLDDV